MSPGRLPAVECRPAAGRLLGESAVLDDTGPPAGARMPPAGVAAVLLALPGAVLVAGIAGPVIWTGWQGAVAGRGLAGNLAAAGATAGNAVLATLLWAVAVPLVVTVLGYLTAVASLRSRHGATVAVVLLVPVTFPLVATGVAVRLLTEPDHGLLAAVLRAVTGRPDLRPGGAWSTAALVAAFVWAWLGPATLVLRHALNAVPRDLVDAVRANGGTWRDVALDALWRPVLRRACAVVFALVSLATTQAADLLAPASPGGYQGVAVLSGLVAGDGTRVASSAGAALGTLWLVVVVATLWLGVRGYRQAWPPPRRAPAEPGVLALGRLRPSGRLVGRVATWGLAGVAALVWVLPMVAVLATSLHAPAATGGWWSGRASLASYRALLHEASMLAALRDTTIMVVVATAAVLLLALPAAAALSWLPARRGAVGAASLALLAVAAVVPVPVLAGPLGWELRHLGLSGGLPARAAAHVVICLPLAVLVLRAGLADLPAGLVAAVRTGGLREVPPLLAVARAAAPAVTCVAVLVAVRVWNDLAVGLLLGPGRSPLGAALLHRAGAFGAGGGQPAGELVAGGGQLAAGCLLAALPPALLVLATRRTLARGLAGWAAR